MERGYPWERPLGARQITDQLTEFRVWAPRAQSIALRVNDVELALADADCGVYAARAPAVAGDHYWFVVDGQQLPDPCTRSQPSGLQGPSQVVAVPRVTPLGRRARQDLVLYELHVGTFTAEGTFDGAIPHLRELAQLGVTAIEIMPVGEFPGARGWGYDGVYISAAQSSYGGPAGLARLVAAAHEAGLAVVLDVVYNHLGASGTDAMAAFGPYFTRRYQTPWGAAINFDGADCDPVREWVLQSATSWVRDFAIDGLRLDAVHAIFDSSTEHIVAAIARRVRAIRPDALVIAESGLNDPRVMRPRERGGYACDAAWSDDFHHALWALLTGERDGYYADFGRVGQLAKAWHRPHVQDGGYSVFRRRRYGAPADDVPAEKFVVYSQNHDQVGNRAYGDRMPPPARALAALCTLLSPFTPMLFMGEEYGETAPFQFFSDHFDERIALATREGRRQEFAAFMAPNQELPDPQAPATFARSKLTRRCDPAIAHLYAQLLRARRELPAGDVDTIEFDDEQRWLRVRRRRFELICNFSSGPLRVRCDRDAVWIGTHDQAPPCNGHLELAPLSGALLR